jgi:excisionase family DNA binding protein
LYQNLKLFDMNVNNLSFDSLPDQVSKLNQKIDQLLELAKSNSAGEAEQSELLTVDQAASLLGLAKQSIYGKLCRNELPAIKPAGSKRVYFQKNDLLEYLEAGRKKTTSEINAEVGKCLIKKRK